MRPRSPGARSRWGHRGYDRSTYAGKQGVRSVVAEGLDAVIVNPTGVIGPYDYGPSRMGEAIGSPRDRRIALLTLETLHALRYCPAVSHYKASNELGYVSRPIHETVRDTLAWFEQRTSAALASRAG